jgi:hypothetical protein
VRRYPPASRTSGNRRKLVVAALVAFISLTSAPGAAAAPAWLNPRYLYRYVFWGIPSTLSKSDDWKLFPYHTIETAPPAFHFIAQSADLPATVEYYDGDTRKSVALEELLQSSGTHAFIVKYFWWGRTSENGDCTFEAQGQYIFVSPKTKIVIVRTGSKWGEVDWLGWPQALRYIAEHLTLKGDDHL